MNTPTRLLSGLVLAVSMIAPLPAQEEPLPPAAEIDDNYPASSPNELDALLGPIALYPDDLVSLILPAATETTDIVLAARYLNDGGSVDRVDQQPWDDSVKAIAHFPEVVTMLNEDLEWTQQVGDEFLLQPAEVMKSIQRLRAKAYAAGTLRDTPQQKVLIDGNVIRIVPAVENVVYVPRYNTEVVYVDSPVYYREPCITFGTGWYIGSWHRWDCDWYNHRVWVFYSHNSWRDHRYHYRHRHYSHRDHDHRHGRAWNPPPRRTHPGSPGYHHRRDNDRNDRRHAGPDRNRDNRNDNRRPGSRNAQPSNPTDVVTRDVINSQRNNGRTPGTRDGRNRDSNRNRDDSDSTRTPGGYRPRNANVNPPANSTGSTTVVTPGRPNTRSHSESTRPHVTRSRAETNRDRSSNRTEQARSPERRSPTSVVANSVRNSSSARVSESRSTTSTSRTTTARSETTRSTGSSNSNASSGRSQVGSQRSSNSSSSSDSGRSRGSSRNDDNNNNNNSDNNSGRSGRGR